MTMAVASSSSFRNSCKYDAFISFRGEDTRKNFTSHLYAALCRNSIQTYIDEKSLERGDEISPALLTAIEESQLSLVIFSKDYASSRWCLDELKHILKCKNERGQIVLPVFYHVDPSDIRHQRGSYAAAFVAHQKRFNHDKNKVEEWRNALKEATGLSGFDLQHDESEFEFVEKIVKNVIEKLENIWSSHAAIDFQGLVGISKRLKKIESLLCVGSSTVRTIGIWGMGGIGKTTLAEALYKQLSSKFDACFFANVKEDANKHGLNSLKERLFCKLLRCDRINMESSFKDVQLLRKRVLVVLDNVNELEQLECLVEESHDVCQQDQKHCFGVGSRIIITSRDKKLLMSRADEIYDVDPLDSDEARRLFYLKAFKRDSAISTDYADPAERVLHYAQGNPLALKVLGSHLHSRSISEWKSALSKLKKGPDGTVQKVLKMSFDALDRIEKSIFLDIACFFRGEDRNFIERILDEESHIGINVLIEKSLVTGCDRISMHDLIQEMGWEIVRQESCNGPAERSRLWIAQDAFHVLENKKGTKSIEGIFLDMSKIDEDLFLEPVVFESMSSLRLLKIYYPDHNNKKKFKVYLHQGLHNLPKSLRYLNWCDYPLKSLPTKFRPESLVELEMPYSQLKQLWDGVQPLQNLKHIDFSFSKQLVKIPDLSRASRLESNFWGCTSLVEVPPLNFQSFDGLKSKDREYAEERAFGSLNFLECINLKILPEISGNIRILRLGDTGIKELPSSIRSHENLFYLDIRNCEKMEKFPELPGNIEILDLGGTSIREIPAASISKLKALTQLDLNLSPNFEHFPQILEPMENLESLSLGRTRIREFPSPIENIMGLRDLDMRECKDLESIPECLSKLSRLERLNLSSSLRLINFPNMILALHSLQYLDLGHCSLFEVPHGIGDLSSLIEINLKGNMFTSIPSSINKLSKLDSLDISHCRNLLSLPELPLSIHELNVTGCTSMQTVLTSSWSTLTLGCDPAFYVDRDYVKFLFYECLKLDENSCNKVAMDFLCRLIGTTVIWKLANELQEFGFYSLKACYPGNRIPKWMRHQSEGCSTTIKLPPNWHSPNFSGFVLCVVLSFEGLYSDQRFDKNIVCIRCETRIKTKYGQSHNSGSSDWMLYKPTFESEDGQEEGGTLRSDHVFIWSEFYNGSFQKYEDYFDAVEMSFIFFCLDNVFTEREYCHFNYQVKRCGVHMLYIEEQFVKKYNMSIQQYVEYMVEAEERGISILQNQAQSKTINFDADAPGQVNILTDSESHPRFYDCFSMEAPLDDESNSAGPSRNSTTTHEEAVRLNIPLSIGSDGDQTNNVERIKCFDFCSCSNFLSQIFEWIQGYRGN